MNSAAASTRRRSFSPSPPSPRSTRKLSLSVNASASRPDHFFCTAATCAPRAMNGNVQIFQNGDATSITNLAARVLHVEPLREDRKPLLDRAQEHPRLVEHLQPLREPPKRVPRRHERRPIRREDLNLELPPVPEKLPEQKPKNPLLLLRRIRHRRPTLADDLVLVPRLVPEQLPELMPLPHHQPPMLPQRHHHRRHSSRPLQRTVHRGPPGGESMSEELLQLASSRSMKMTPYSFPLRAVNTAPEASPKVHLADPLLAHSSWYR